MQFLPHDGKLLIAPEPGYSPHIGVLVATMQRCRETTLLLIENLTVAQLDAVFDADDNSIGALLMHLAAIEAAYQEYTFTGRNILDNPERIEKWAVPMDLGEVARQTIRGNTAAYYVQELTTIRDQTRAQLQQYTDNWLWQEADWNGMSANNYWMWYHVYEDEINHRGEIHWRLSRLHAFAHAPALL